MSAKKWIISVFLVGFGGILLAQSTSHLKTRPTGHNILRVDAIQLFVNELRLGYEIPVHKMHSIEVGAGFMYPNPILANTEYFSDFYLSTGGSVKAGYKFYPKVGSNARIFPIQSYLNAEIFGSQSSYNEQWFTVEFPENSRPDEQHQVSSTFRQAGFRALIGFQNRKGRVVTDIYFGLGVKMVQTSSVTHIITPGNESIIRPTSTFPESQTSITDFTATPHLGLKLGLRTKGK